MIRRQDLYIAAGIFVLIAGLLYVPRTAPSVLFERDSAEFQVLGYFMGIPHATGYPLYIFVLKAFSFLPVGDIAYRANLLSALSAAAAVALLYLVAFLFLSGESSETNARISAAAGALATAWTYTLWSQAIRAEVYAFHAVLCLAVLLLVWLWGSTRRFGYLVCAAGLWALALGHHRLIVSLVPPVALYLLASDRSWMTPRRIAMMICAILAGAAAVVLLFYVLWRRDLPFDQFHRNILAAADLYGRDPQQLRSFWPAFWFQTTGGQFKSLMFGQSFPQQLSQAALLPARIVSEFFGIGAVLILTGFVTGWKNRAWQLFLAAWVLSQLYINVNYTTLGVEVYYISIFLVCGVWFSRGMAFVLERVGGAPLRAALLALLVLVLNPYSAPGFAARIARALPVEGPYMAVASGARPGLRNFYAPLEKGRKLVDVVGSDAVIYGPWQYQFVVEYVSRIERNQSTLEYYERKPLSSSPAEFSSLYLRHVEDVVGARPVYFLGVPPSIVRRQFKVADLGGGLYRVYR